MAVVYDTERVSDDASQDWDKLDDADIAQNHLVDFLFDPKYAVGDIYASFDQVL